MSRDQGYISEVPYRDLEYFGNLVDADSECCDPFLQPLVPGGRPGVHLDTTG